MKKYVIAPDSFKGSMSSVEICHITREQILRRDPRAEVICIPVADGGEGSVDCFLQALGGEKITVRVCGVFSDTEVEAYYGLIHGGKTAVIEMAVCAGLPLAGERADPRIATTFGVGQLILDASKKGVETIIMGLGGSATNDGGCGAAAAVGVKFYDQNDNSFIPVGGTLKEIERIDLSARDQRLENINFITMCDIDNPMVGESGAATVFAPQKGADADTVKLLDDGLGHLAQIMKQDLGQELSQRPGTGAAGAMGAGMIAFFDSKLQMGIDTVLDTVNFEELVKNADLIFTGEGKIDSQSLRGKVVVGVSRRAKPLGVPVIAIVGGIGDDIEPVYDEGVSGIFSINRAVVALETAKANSKNNLAMTIDNFMRFYMTVSKA